MNPVKPFLFLAAASGLALGAPDYQKDVVPILREYCVGCHNDSDLDGDLSMETYARFLKGGGEGASFEPGNATASHMIKLMEGLDKPVMPPKKEPQPSKEQVAILKAWIDAGAKGPAVDESILATLTVPNIKPAVKTAPAITAAAYSPNGKVLALAKYREVELLDAASNATLRRLSQAPGKINALHFSADGKLILAASGVTGLRGEAVLWNAETGQLVREFGPHRDDLYDAEISPDGKVVATAGYDARILIWNAADGTLIRTIEGHNGAIYDLAFSPDSTVLASASGDQTVKVWKVATGERLDTLNQPQAEQFTVAFSPDGQSIYAGGADNRIRRWNFISKQKAQINPLLQARFAHEGAIVEIALSADGKWLASSSADRTIKVWRLPSLDAVDAHAGQPDVAAALAVNGNQFLAARLDGSREVYTVSLPPVEPAAKAAAVPASEDEVVIAPMELAKVMEKEDSQPASVPVPSRIEGTIHQPKDADTFRFHAQAGEHWVLEIDAAKSGSPLDSKVEVLNADGSPLPMTQLQAVRDTWFTFVGQDSNSIDGFRLHNWEEMELNEYLYANGEITKLWLYPRGPDSGFKLYPGFGNRQTYFASSALAHPLGEPCYIVKPYSPGAVIKPNGLPVYTLYHENDDDPLRRLGSDSRLNFTVPADGDYLARVTDVRGFGGSEFRYALTIRPSRPDFKITVDAPKPVNAGSGKELLFKAERIDGFEGEIRVEVTNLPPGFTTSGPVTFQEEQSLAMGAIYAAADAPKLTPELAKAAKIVATAEIGGKKVMRDSGNLPELKLAAKPKLRVELLPLEGELAPGKPLELTMRPGETISARVRIHRDGFEGPVSLGKEDAGRNFPHGVFVDNIGLNGLLIPEGQTERVFYITSAKWVPEGARTFHLNADADGGQSTAAGVLHIQAK